MITTRIRSRECSSASSQDLESRARSRIKRHAAKRVPRGPLRRAKGVRDCERAGPATAALGRHATNDVGGQGSRRGRREPLALRKRVTCAAAMRDTRTHTRHPFLPPVTHIHAICK